MSRALRFAVSLVCLVVVASGASSATPGAPVNVERRADANTVTTRSMSDARGDVRVAEGVSLTRKQRRWLDVTRFRASQTSPRKAQVRITVAAAPPKRLNSRWTWNVYIADRDVDPARVTYVAISANNRASFFVDREGDDLIACSGKATRQNRGRTLVAVIPYKCRWRAGTSASAYSYLMKTDGSYGESAGDDVGGPAHLKWQY